MTEDIFERILSMKGDSRDYWMHFENAMQKLEGAHSLPHRGEFGLARRLWYVIPENVLVDYYEEIEAFAIDFYGPPEQRRTLMSRLVELIDFEYFNGTELCSEMFLR